MTRHGGSVDPAPNSNCVPVDHHLRIELGARVAGLVLGAVIQGGPRRRGNGRIPSPRRRNAGRRPNAAISFVALDLPGSPRPDRVVVVRRDSPEALAPETDDQPLRRWENEGGRTGPEPSIPTDYYGVDAPMPPNNGTSLVNP